MNKTNKPTLLLIQGKYVGKYVEGKQVEATLTSEAGFLGCL